MKCVAPGGILKFWTLILNLVFPEGITTKGRYCPSFEFGLFPQNISYCLPEWFLSIVTSTIPDNTPTLRLLSRKEILNERSIFGENKKNKKNFKRKSLNILIEFYWFKSGDWIYKKDSISIN